MFNKIAKKGFKKSHQENMLVLLKSYWDVEMKKKDDKHTSTFHTRLHLTEHLTEDSNCIMNAFAELMGKVERSLFKDIARGLKANELKSSYQKQFKITARHFNACRIQLEGKIASIKELRPIQINDCKSRIQSLTRTNQELEKKKAKPFTIHHKKRRLFNLTNKLNNLLSDESTDKVRMCFGSNKLFHAQFALDENGYNSFEEWLQDWQEARSNSFFLVGSQDETAGNQSCVATIEEDGTFSLRIRLPDALAEDYGKYLIIPGVRFKYGHDVLLSNLQKCNQSTTKIDKKYKKNGVAINYRFKRDEKGWRVFVSTSLEEPVWITRKDLGAIGIDINADCLAVTETDRFGNPIQHRVIPLITYGKSRNQSKALTQEAAVQLVDWAIATQKPLVLEKLRFDKKKTELKESNNPKYARMLSSFSYNAIISAIKSRGWRFGVKVEEVNPAFTTIIGRVKFAQKYGLSVHESAALCIARRYLGFSERLPRCLGKIPDGKNDHVTLFQPARNRNKHVWSLWGQIKRKLSTVLAAHFRAKKRSSSRSPPVCCERQGLLDLVGV